MGSKKNNLSIIIVCGGKGKRLGMITKNLPKPMVKIGRSTLIEQKIHYYKKNGISDLTFCLGYKSNILKKFLSKISKKFKFYDNGTKPGILKRIFLARKSIKGTTIISYGDTLAKINFNELIKTHNKLKTLLTLVVSPIKNPFGLVNWNTKGQVTNFVEKPTLNHFIGYAVIEPDIFRVLPKKIVNLKDGEGFVKAIQYLIKKKMVNIYKFKGLQITINSPKELREAKVKFKKYFTLDENFKK